MGYGPPPPRYGYDDYAGGGGKGGGGKGKGKGSGHSGPGLPRSVTGEPPPTPGPPPPPPETDGEPTNLFIFDKLVEREKARVRRDFRMADDIREVSVPPSASNAIECLRGPLFASNDSKGGVWLQAV